MCLSNAYHPQSDGQTEVINRCSETYLRLFAGTQPKQWTKWLLWAELWYNTTFHASINMTPFKVVYGRPSPTINTYASGETLVGHLDNELQDHDHNLRRLKEHLLQAQFRIKAQADKRRSVREFNEGDWVFCCIYNHTDNLHVKFVTI